MDAMWVERALRRRWLVCFAVLVASPVPAEAAAPAAPARYALKCHASSANRYLGGQAQELLGMWSGWTDRERMVADEKKGVLASASLDGLLLAGERVTALRLQDGRLTSDGKGVVGSIL